MALKGLQWIIQTAALRAATLATIHIVSGPYTGLNIVETRHSVKQLFVGS